MVKTIYPLMHPGKMHHEKMEGVGKGELDFLQGGKGVIRNDRWKSSAGSWVEQRARAGHKSSVQKEHTEKQDAL